MTESDIVTRLRLTPVLMYGDKFNQNRIDYEACKRYINNEGVKMMREAAAEIERLRAEASELRGWKGDALHSYQVCAMERDRLRAERDEARREVCKNVVAISASMNAKQWARERGWDCFKENNT